MNIFSNLFGKKDEAIVDNSTGIENCFAELDKSLKLASISQIGGFRPPEDPLASWFGDHAVKRPEESVPEYKGKSMFPLLQVNVAELPFVPEKLKGIKLFVVWINQDEIPFDLPHGEGWLVREYSSLGGLEKVEDVSKPDHLKTFPIKWTLSETEGPGWEAAWELTDLSAINDDEKVSDQFFDRYENFSGTKVGGYPSEIQHGFANLGDFVFQVGSEEKANWMWADNGIAYFFKNDDNSWEFQCQFY